MSCRYRIETGTFLFFYRMEEMFSNKEEEKEHELNEYHTMGTIISATKRPHPLILASCVIAHIG